MNWADGNFRRVKPLMPYLMRSEIEAPIRLAELEAGGESLGLLPARKPDEGMRKLDQLMEREPERVAAQVRHWLSED